MSSTRELVTKVASIFGPLGIEDAPILVNPLQSSSKSRCAYAASY